jgi:predicted regulator of Ras-like GTPase activity (Roadblock/LC7/MglB family)
MFLERLADVSRRISGSLALCLVDGDGIPVEAVSSNPDLDLEVLAAEMVAQVRALTDDLSELEAGRFQHYSLTTDSLTLMVSSVADGYYLLLVLDRGGNRGRARFELRRARLLMESDLF